VGVWVWCRYLERVYGVGVVRIDTMNYNGKTKRGARGLYDRRDFKKAVVTVNAPFAFPDPPADPDDAKQPASPAT
jgi:hypothetical protein